MKRTTIGILFWSMFAVVIFALFILNKNTIAAVFEKTQAKKLFFQTVPDQTVEKLPEIQIQHADAVPQTDGDDGKDSAMQQRDPQSDENAPLEQSVSAADSDTEEFINSPSNAPSETAALPAQEADTVDMRKITVYWVTTDDDGKITRRAGIRVIPKSQSPMTDALTVLLAGPQPEEARAGMLSLIPEGTTLLSAWVKDGTAFIDMSDEFQFNRYGIDGYLTQLAQIVFTATEFSTVNTVQFLIEGRKREYLGAEGVWIGSPLGRSAF